jgi:hypothetical protein
VCLFQYHKRIYLPKYTLLSKSVYCQKQKGLELRQDFQSVLGEGTHNQERKGHGKLNTAVFQALLGTEEQFQFLSSTKRY